MPTIILPTKNEAESIADAIATVRRVCSEPVVVVDGWSTDGTQRIACKCEVPVITDDVKGKGKGAGLRKAFGWVDRNIRQSDKDIIFVDPDMTYPLSAIPSFISALREYDLVVGERTKFDPKSLSFSFMVGDWLSRRLFGIIYGRKLDNLSGFRGLSRRAIDMMNLTEDGFGIETEITAKAVKLGLRIKNIPIHYHPREGKSKFRPIKDAFVVLRTMWRYKDWQT